MQLVLDDDQTLLAETAQSFVREHCPLSRIRKLRDDPKGFDPAVWAKIVDLGWTAIPFAEEEGGLGLGLAETICVTEALGSGLATEPFVGNVMLAGACVARAGTPAQKERLLAPMIAGELHLALGSGERGARFDPFYVKTRAKKSGDGYVLDGEKAQVLGGNVADQFVVAARTSGSDRDSGGLSLFIVPRGARGLSVVPQRRVDSVPAALLRLDGVTVGAADRLGAEGGGGPILQAVVDGATVALSAEMLGAMTRAFDMTVQYLKERVQFGVPIGSFQALKHRAARMFVELSLTRSVVMAAARAIDEDREQAPVLVATAKARASDAFLLVANEAIQMHGGIGMTDEHDIGFFLKRARATEMTFGDAAYHRDRLATLHGF